MSSFKISLFAAACLIFAVDDRAAAQEKKTDVDAMVHKGLEWFKNTQKADGSWSSNGTYQTTMTALGGMALLMEGSTLREGKYSDNLVKAVDWFLKTSQSNGLLGNPNNPTEGSRYIYGHGFGMLFLASVYGEEEDASRRKKLEVVLKKAVEFSCKAVTTKGGWGYVSGKDGNDFDEGSTTITQMQGLRAARNAGIVVPKGTIDNATKYLEKCTTPAGGVIYNLTAGRVATNGSERPPITAAAVACAFSAGQYENETAKKWIKFCKTAIYQNDQHGGHDDYQSYYFGQAMYVLGDDRYGKLFPDEKKENWMTWTAYKTKMFEYYRSRQGADGSWSGGYAGAELSTAFALTILQLDKGTLPIYHR